MTSCGIHTMMSLGTSSSVVHVASHGIHTVTSFGSNIPTVNEPHSHTLVSCALLTSLVLQAFSPYKSYTIWYSICLDILNKGYRLDLENKS
jgi:hypothetical protein